MPYRRLQQRLVLPAHAGMIPIVMELNLEDGCAPRACGDDPLSEPGAVKKGECSPRMRG